MIRALACLIALLAVAPKATAPPSPQGAAIPAAAFVDRIGINIHLPYTDGRYADADKVISDLRYLGLQNVRDWSLKPTGQGQESYQRAAAAGVKFDLIFREWSIPEGIAPLNAYFQRHPASVVAIEGPNEVNNEPVEFNGLKGDAAAQALQAALYRAVKADPTLRPVPVFNVTSYPDLKGEADYANFHAYAHNGDQPGDELAKSLARQRAVMPSGPIVLTESGYTTLASDRDGVDERTQAKLTLNTLFDGIRLGASRVYLYELLDAYADPAGADKQRHFGLFRFDGSPKPAATAVHNLSAILAVAGKGGGAPGQHPRFQGMPADGRSLTLTAADGGVVVALWREPRIWDHARRSPVAVPGVRMTVTARAPVEIYDPLQASTPVAKTGRDEAASFELVDHVVLVRVLGGGAHVSASLGTSPFR